MPDATPDNPLWTLLGVIAGVGVLCVLAAYAGPLALRAAQARRWRKHGRGLMALTYDDGPDAVTTPAVLSLLDGLGVPATFYLVGFRGEEQAEVARSMIRPGHELGTHTHSHKNAWKKGPMFEWRDAMRAYRTLGDVVSPEAPYRPPFGKMSLPVWVGMRLRGRRVDWWNDATNDTRRPDQDPRALAEHLVNSGGPTVLMHCHHAEPERRAFVLALTRELVELGRARGLRFVTVGGLEEACR